MLIVPRGRWWSVFVEGLGLAAVLAAASFLRLVWLDTVPPGWHYDEAVQGVWAREIWQGLQHPIFFSAFSGQEPLYMYLAAGVMAVVGDQGAFTVRLTSALIGLGTILLTYLLTRELYGRRLAWLAAALVALSLWHLIGSRNGYRTISQPLFQLLALYFLVLGLKSGRWWPYALGGVALGLTAYTYIASRAFPLVLVLFGAWWLWRRGLPTSGVLLRLGLFLALAAAIFAPLGYHYLTNPSDFWGRMEQVSFLNPGLNQGNPLGALADSVLKLLGMYTVYGDPLWRFNVTERPIFVGALVPLFYLGLLIFLWRLKRGDLASVFLPFWILVMLLPALFSAEAMPYTQRAIGILPAIFVIPAFGIALAWEGLRWVLRPWPPLWRQGLPLALLGLLLAAETATTWRDYFVVRAQSFHAQLDTDVDLVATAQFLNRYVAAEETLTIVASTRDYHDPTLAHLAPRVYPRLRWMDGSQGLALVEPQGEDVLYVFSHAAMPRDTERLFPEESLVARETYANGLPKLLAYRLSPEAMRQIVRRIEQDPQSRPLGVSLGDSRVELLSYRLASEAVAGEALSLQLFWRIRGLMDTDDYWFFTHLLDGQGQLWGQGDAIGYLAQEWRPQDAVLGWYDIAVRPATPQGLYKVRVGLYHRPTMARVLLDPPRQGDSLDLGLVRIRPRGPVIPERIQYPQDVTLAGSIRLKGADLQGPPRAGAPLGVTLYWVADAIPDKDYTVFVHLVDTEGRLVAQADGMPVQNHYPTSFWEPGEGVADRHEVALPADLPPGRYQVRVGLYLLATGERLRTTQGQDAVAVAEVALPR